MRRKPTSVDEDYAVPKGAFVNATRKQANQVASAVQPFLVSGGMSYWITSTLAPFDPAVAGVQLLCTMYVPRGRMGFIKQMRVAPLCPSVLCDPWSSSGAAGAAASWRDYQRIDAISDIPLPQMGDVWRIPFGWEAAWDDDSVSLPSWTWSLRYVQGDYNTLRSQGKNIPPFSTAVSASWYLVPNIPVPASAYPQGLPGNAAGPQWDAQRLQILPKDELTYHIPIPQDTTVLLFAQWSQSDVRPYAQDVNGGIALTSALQYNNGRVYPIGPSMGSLLGYTQSVTSKAAVKNLEEGWGG